MNELQKKSMHKLKLCFIFILFSVRRDVSYNENVGLSIGFDLTFVGLPLT